jgi:hypothetical protein
VCQTAIKGDDVADMGPRKSRCSRGEGTETLANRKAAIALPGRCPADNAAANTCRLNGIGALDRSAAG